MPNFSLRITAGATSTIWQDPATATLPSRLNPIAQHQHRCWFASPLLDLVLQATVGGVEGPADAALGGKLFKWSWVEQADSGWSAPIPATAGFTSITTFPAGHFHSHGGHYTLLCWRDGGGAVAIPFEILSL